MDHVLLIPLCLHIELERRLVTSPELSKGTLERRGLGYPRQSRTSGSIYLDSCLLLLLDLTS
jgi:hypothetical protein